MGDSEVCPPCSDETEGETARRFDAGYGSKRSSSVYTFRSTILREKRRGRTFPLVRADDRGSRGWGRIPPLMEFRAPQGCEGYTWALAERVGLRDDEHPL